MYEFSKRTPVLHQISSGLREFGILDSIKTHPQLLEPVFTKSSFSSQMQTPSLTVWWAISVKMVQMTNWLRLMFSNISQISLKIVNALVST